MDILWILWTIPAVIAVEGKLMFPSQRLKTHHHAGLSLRQSACVDDFLFSLNHSSAQFVGSSLFCRGVHSAKYVTKSQLGQGMIMGHNDICSRVSQLALNGPY